MKILKYIFPFLLIWIGTKGINAQTAKIPLSRVINVSSTTQIAPSLSGDGRHMIYTSTSNLKSEMLVFYAFQQRPGKWTQPEPISVINRSLNINHLGGYDLSYDGNYIFFTSRKTYGIGKYDIWYSKKYGKNQWTAPVNLGKPINSNLNDGCPSISPDGRTMYFVRCQTMDQKEGTGCRLMMANKKNQEYWGEPVALPDYINDGNIMSPKILADNQTLIYAKGEGNEWDLYQTRRSDQGWSKPVALDFVNTERDERFASVPAQGDVMYYSTMFQGTYDIVKSKIPEELQPLKVMYLKGEVVNRMNEPMEAFIQIYDADKKDLVQYHRTSDQNSEFEFYLTAGKQYDFSAVPLAPKYAFHSEFFDLRELEKSSRMKLNMQLQDLEPGSSFTLQCVQFENDSTLSSISKFELSRLIKLLKNNPGIQVEIGVHGNSQPPDSLQTEEFDSLTVAVADSSSLVGEPLQLTESSLQAVDSLVVPDEIQPPPPDATEIKAQTISKYLHQRGVPEYLLQPKGYQDSEPVAPNDTEENRALNRRVEIKIL